jgi:tetratricopeptide (TPR) repeat protein
MAGRDDEAITICKALAAENPAFAIAHDCLYYAYWQKRMYAPAIEELKANANLMHDPDELENSAALERGFHSGGWTGAAHELIATIENRRKTHYGSPFVIARLYADLGEKEKALEWLDTAYREHDCLLIELKAWPQFASLHADPRFAGLADKIGLPR